MRRREFITLLGGATAAWPLAGRAQQPPMPVIGYLGPGSAASYSGFLTAFREGLAQKGYSEGGDYRFAERHADGVMARMPELAQEVIRLDPRVIVTGNTAATLAARHFTTTIPLVCATCTDPIGMGLALSEARPGMNVTGNLTRVEGLTAKQVEIASEMVPGLSKLGVLVNPGNESNPVQMREAHPAAAKLTLVPVEATTSNELYPAFDALSRAGVKMVLVLQDGMFLTERKRIAILAAVAKLPTAFAFRENVEDGGLLSYGINVSANYRRAAFHVERILRGTKPGDLPFEFPTRLELVINLGTAKALGLEVPPTLLARADEVIE